MSQKQSNSKQSTRVKGSLFQADFLVSRYVDAFLLLLDCDKSARVSDTLQGTRSSLLCVSSVSSAVLRGVSTRGQFAWVDMGVASKL